MKIPRLGPARPATTSTITLRKTVPVPISSCPHFLCPHFLQSRCGQRCLSPFPHFLCPHFQDRKLWKGLASVGMVESERTVGGNRSVERRCYLSSLPLGAEAFARAVRGHWGVENRLHWSLDVTFREDQSRARARHAAQNLATLRRLALNLVKNDKTKKLPLRQKPMLAAMDHEYLKQLLGV